MEKFYSNMDLNKEQCRQMCLVHDVCYWVVLSKFLGWGMVIVSSLVKLPQIIKIRGARSGKGINIISTTLELMAISGNFSYGFANGFPFSSYGESPFVSLQDAIIMFHILLYEQSNASALTFLGVYGAVMTYLLSPFAPLRLLVIMQNLNTLIVLVGKFLQISTNYRNKGTGQLSVYTVTLVLIGSYIRIFTSMQETGDTAILATYFSSSVMNTIIVSQCIYYWRKGHRQSKDTAVNGEVNKTK